LARAGASLADRVFVSGTAVIAGLIIALVGTIVVLLFLDARPSIVRYGLGFLTQSGWDPVFEKFGAWPYIYGTLMTSATALVLAAPVGIGAAIFVAEYAPDWFRSPVGFLVELLAAIPSIVYGLWGVFVLSPFMRSVAEPALKTITAPIPVVSGLFQGPAIGKDFLIGGVILAIMILPTIASVSREVLRAVPDTQREAMLALGATKWEVISRAVLPYSRGGIAAACILGLARALGETMAVTLLIGNSSARINGSLLTPGYTMASAIANQFIEADKPIYFSAIVEVALVLLLVSTILNLLARFITFAIWRGPADVRL
jgi:phosphate transport system permease protein